MEIGKIWKGSGIIFTILWPTPNAIHLFLYENFLQENEPQKPKMLKKSPDSNPWATILKNADFS